MKLQSDDNSLWVNWYKWHLSVLTKVEAIILSVSAQDDVKDTSRESAVLGCSSTTILFLL